MGDTLSELKPIIILCLVVKKKLFVVKAYNPSILELNISTEIILNNILISYLNLTCAQIETK